MKEIQAWNFKVMEKNLREVLRVERSNLVSEGRNVCSLATTRFVIEDEAASL
jgi:hypothetical protein